MKTLSPRFRKMLIRCCIVLVVLIGALGYGFFQIFQDLKVPINGVPNNLDAQEAERKLAIFKEAKSAGRNGFVRLSEVEINSHLFQNIQIDQKKSAESGLRKSRILLSGDQIGYWCWLEKEILGRKMVVVWRRQFELYRNISPVGFRMTSMKLGNVEVPRQYWPKVNAWLGTVDNEFQAEIEWLKGIPVLEIHTNEYNQQTEARIYTKPITETPERPE